MIAAYSAYPNNTIQTTNAPKTNQMHRKYATTATVLIIHIYYF